MMIVMGGWVATSLLVTWAMSRAARNLKSTPAQPVRPDLKLVRE